MELQQPPKQEIQIIQQQNEISSNLLNELKIFNKFLRQDVNKRFNNIETKLYTLINNFANFKKNYLVTILDMQDDIYSIKKQLVPLSQQYQQRSIKQTITSSKNILSNEELEEEKEKIEKEKEELGNYNTILQNIENNIQLRTKKDDINTSFNERFNELETQIDTIARECDAIKIINLGIENLREKNLGLEKDLDNTKQVLGKELLELNQKYNSLQQHHQKLETMYKDLKKELDNIVIFRLDNATQNIHQIRTSNFWQGIMNCFGFLGIGTSLALIYYLWHYTHK